MITHVVSLRRGLYVGVGEHTPGKSLALGIGGLSGACTSVLVELSHDDAARLCDYLTQLRLWGSGTQAPPAPRSLNLCPRCGRVMMLTHSRGGDPFRACSCGMYRDAWDQPVQEPTEPEATK